MKTINELFQLKNRTAIITGATGALGRVMAMTLAELGADLILVDLPRSDFKSLEKELQMKWSAKSTSIPCDLENEASRLNLIKKITESRIEINCLINNAAFVGSSELTGWAVPFEKQSLETWRRAFEVNLTAAFHLSQALTPILRSSIGGNIINITSIYGQYGPDWKLYENTDMGNPAAYGVSKGGLVQLTRWLSTTLAPEIRVNAIAPGGVFRNQPKKFVDRYAAKTPLKRMAIEEDFKGVIAFLASDLSNYVTGQVLNVDGGWGVW